MRECYRRLFAEKAHRTAGASAVRAASTVEGDTNMKRIQKPKPQTRRPPPDAGPLIDKLDLLILLGLK